MASTDDPMDRVRALGRRLEEAAQQLGLTMENFSVIPGNVANDPPVDLCQAVFSLAPENVIDDPTPPDVELGVDEREAFAHLEDMFNQDPAPSNGPTVAGIPTEEEVRDFLAEDD